jgi:hypothetical protein
VTGKKVLGKGRLVLALSSLGVDLMSDHLPFAGIWSTSIDRKSLVDKIAIVGSLEYFTRLKPAPIFVSV